MNLSLEEDSILREFRGTTMIMGSVEQQDGAPIVPWLLVIYMLTSGLVRKRKQIEVITKESSLHRGGRAPHSLQVLVNVIAR